MSRLEWFEEKVGDAPYQFTKCGFRSVSDEPAKVVQLKRPEPAPAPQPKDTRRVWSCARIFPNGTQCNSHLMILEEGGEIRCSECNWPKTVRWFDPAEPPKRA